MKVVRIISSLDFGGVEKVLEITAAYYGGDKKDILFVCLGEGGATEKTIMELGYRIIVWKHSVRIPQIWLIARLMTLFRQERPVVVHTAGAEANFHGILAAYLSGIPVRVAEEIGMPNHSRKAKIIFRFLYRRASRVIAVAGLVKEYLIVHREVRKECAEVIYNPVDLRDRDNAERNETIPCFRVVAVCRLDPIKNLDLLIRGFSALSKGMEAASELWIVGAGPSRGVLEALTQELGLSDKVTFWGFQPKPARFLEGASLFVLPSFSEGIPLAVAEAMIKEVPCAVTRIGGAPEFITQGYSGWLFDPLDQEGFDCLLKDIVALSEESRRIIGRHGRDVALEKFHPERYMRQIWGLYEEILDIKRR